MTHSFPQRLHMARTMRGHSMQSLSDLLDGQLSKQAIGKYEKGEAIPRKDNLIALANALELKLDFFDREISVDINPSFRKLDSLSPKHQDKIIELTRDFVERYIQAEHLVGETLPFKEYQKYTCSSLEEAEQNAFKLREDWDLGKDPLHNIVETLEEKGIKVLRINFQEDDFSGLSSPLNNGHAVIVINTKHKIDRQRFTALHELGHLVMNFTEESPKKDIESFCNRFASAMLIPADVAIKELGPSRKNILIPELIIIKGQYGISPQAMMKRAAELGIIKEHRSKRFFQDLKARNLLKEEIGNFNGEEKSSRLNQIILKGVAEDYITSSMAASILNISVSKFRDQLNYEHVNQSSDN
jgi:Zn-dependent peptidase ImmA (M78 family)